MLGDLSVTDQGVTVDGDTLTVHAHDLLIDSPDPQRRKNANPALRRAMVHDFNDGLTINWQSDYPGGVTISGNVYLYKSSAETLDLWATIRDLQTRVAALEASAGTT